MSISRGCLTPRLRSVDEVLGAVYRVDLAADDWLRGLRDISPIDHVASLAAAFDCKEPGNWRLQNVDGAPEGLRIFSAIREYSPPRQLCGAQSEDLKTYPLPAPWSEWYGPFGVKDVWGIFARAPDDTLLCLSYALAQRARTPPRAKRFWKSVAVHLTAATRLRNLLAKKPEAVLSANGELLHAEGIARDQESREALRRAARAIDKAKLKTSEPLAAIESWTAMVEGRWSLVDEFESDGRRFLVARVNEPALASKKGLSAREAHIAALIALGRSNKEIAYELGLAPTSIASYVGRLRKKLGVRRAELIR